MVAHLVSYSHRFKEFYGDHCANMTPLGTAVTSIAELASTAATDVGMHGLLASQSCYHSVLLPCLCTLWTSSRFLHY